MVVILQCSGIQEVTRYLLCSEREEDWFVDEMERFEKRLNDHGERLRALETLVARYTERLDALCHKMDSLADSIADLMEFLKTCLWKALGGGGAVFLALLGFFFWYVQHLGGG
jgi:hypothetical protein